MADTKPNRLTLVGRALDADGLTVGDNTRKVLDAYAGSIAKQAKKEATAELLTRLGTQTLEEASQLAKIRAERDARPTAGEEAKHGKYRFWQGVAMGGAIIGSIVAIAAALYTDSVIDSAFDAAGEMRARADLVEQVAHERRDAGLPSGP